MPTIKTPTAVQTADALDKAADHLDRVGHHKGYLYDTDQADAGTPLTDCRVCAAGAINIAVYGQPAFPSRETTEGELQLEFRAFDALVAHLRLGVTTLPDWNDAEDRQKRTVVKAFRDTAASLRAGVAA